MRAVYPISGVVLSLFLQAASGAAPDALTAPDLTVGRHLQAAGSVRLPQVAPQPGVKLTITSDDPKRLLLSNAPDRPGSASIDVNVMPLFRDSLEFWAQGLGDSGSVTYSVQAPGFGAAKGTVTLAPSGIAIVGPFRIPSFPTTPRSQPSKLSLVSVRLGPDSKVAEEQPVAAGFEFEVTVKNSNPEVGKVEPAAVKFAAGSSAAVAYFKPAAAGNASMEPAQPPGFQAPADLAAVLAAVDEPGLAITDDFIVGKDLQVPGLLCLGEPPPPGGLTVTLTSSDPGKLLLSGKADQLGSGSITLKVPEGELIARYYLQGMADSGTLTYKAAAPGFRSRIARIGMAPSGVIVAYERYGPPDEAAVLRKGPAAADERRFFVSLEETKKQMPNVVVWSVRLDPESHMAADITVQDLRPGVTAQVTLTSSNGEVATVESPLTIASGTNHVISKVTALRKGETVISVNTPKGFATPKNATSVPATVMD